MPQMRPHAGPTVVDQHRVAIIAIAGPDLGLRRLADLRARGHHSQSQVKSLAMLMSGLLVDHMFHQGRELSSLAPERGSRRRRDSRHRSRSICACRYKRCRRFRSPRAWPRLAPSRARIGRRRPAIVTTGSNKGYVSITRVRRALLKRSSLGTPYALFNAGGRVRTEGK